MKPPSMLALVLAASTPMLAQAEPERVHGGLRKGHIQKLTVVADHERSGTFDQIAVNQAVTIESEFP